MQRVIRAQVEKELAKGVRAFKQLAKFSPFLAGASLSYADCAAGVHLPLVSLSTKIVFGRDVLEDCAPVKPYLKMLNERPAFKKMNDDRKAATEATTSIVETPARTRVLRVSSNIRGSRNNSAYHLRVNPRQTSPWRESLREKTATAASGNVSTPT